MIVNYYMKFISKVVCGIFKYEVIIIKYFVEYVRYIFINGENYIFNFKENIE